MNRSCLARNFNREILPAPAPPPLALGLESPFRAATLLLLCYGFGRVNQGPGSPALYPYPVHKAHTRPSLNLPFRAILPATPPIFAAEGEAPAYRELPGRKLMAPRTPYGEGAARRCLPGKRV